MSNADKQQAEKVANEEALKAAAQKEAADQNAKNTAEAEKAAKEAAEKASKDVPEDDAKHYGGIKFPAYLRSLREGQFNDHNTGTLYTRSPQKIDKAPKAGEWLAVQIDAGNIGE